MGTAPGRRPLGTRLGVVRYTAGMHATSRSPAWRASRRSFLAASAASLATARGLGQAPAGAERCLRCGGLGLAPVADAKPFVWIEGAAAPKPETAVAERHCPLCHNEGDSAELVQAFQERLAAAREQHGQWEERTGGRLTLVVTRHAALHTQYTAAQSRQIGQAVEMLMLHLRRITGSLVLVPSRLGKYEQILLWERPAWDQFRKVMEGLYTPKQLGETWPLAREYNSYDHFVTPHLFETPQTIRSRPVTHGPVFLAARRQICLATNWQAPVWLSEGFAEYGDYAVHKANRWYTIYDTRQRPPTGDWYAEARRLAAAGNLRPWDKMTSRELRDWEANDYVQTLGMVAFLLESEPGKFLDYCLRLAAGDDRLTTLEQAYRASREELDERCVRWLVARR